MKKINISEEKFKKALKEIFKEEVLNGASPDNYDPFGLENDMGVGNDGTLNHDVGTVGEPSDPTEYDPGFEEEYEDPDWYRSDVNPMNDSPSDDDLYNGRW